MLEERLAGRDVPTGDPDREHAEAVARPVRDTQALVAGRRAAALRRLPGYLRPYRRQLALGLAGDLYHIADPARLDQRSRELLWAFID